MLQVLHAVVDVLGAGVLILMIVAVFQVIALVFSKRFAKPVESEDCNWDEQLFLQNEQYNVTVEHDNKNIKPKE